MPVIHDTSLQMKYYLLSFDEDCNELDDADGINNKLSLSILEELKSDSSITDVFVLCHGWLVDSGEVEHLYNEWIGCFLTFLKEKREKSNSFFEFNPLIIAIHWPSRPVPQVVAEDELTINNWLVELISSIPSHLRRQGRTAVQLANELLLHLINDQANINIKPKDILLQLAYITSFFKMKELAFKIGSQSIAELLAIIKTVFTGKIHLLGHSFGSLALSAALVNAAERDNDFSVETLFLIQGALSHWSYCPQIPGMKYESGEFANIIRKNLVNGITAATHSKNDLVLSWAYSRAMKILDARRYHSKSVYPDYGSLGTFGARGYDFSLADTKIIPANGKYFFKSSIFYNLDADEVFTTDTIRGVFAHNNFVKPETANAAWHACLHDQL